MIFKILYQNLYSFDYGISTIKAKSKKEAEAIFYKDGRIKFYDIISITKTK